MRAKDKEFNINIKLILTCPLGSLNGSAGFRRVLNLLNNAFYAVNEKKKRENLGQEPQVRWETSQRTAKLK
jgi:hypothetical protein